MARRKVDPKNVHASYLFDLHESCRVFGEFSHFFLTSGRGKNAFQEVISTPELNIETELSYSTSKKVDVGMKTIISFHVEDREMEGKIGYIDKEKDALTGKDVLRAVLWFPWNIINHIHLSFISSTPRSITLSGFDLYRRGAYLSGIHISDDYDIEDYC